MRTGRIVRGPQIGRGRALAFRDDVRYQCPGCGRVARAALPALRAAARVAPTRTVRELARTLGPCLSCVGGQRVRGEHPAAAGQRRAGRGRRQRGDSGTFAP